ncbi:MAG TPA: CBS domain-containing protein [Candidatus Saccharibacteria bacterium]|nr:CBS domain-containing protein [Candidatus Saccharibacteria bacterium]
MHSIIVFLGWSALAIVSAVRFSQTPLFSFAERERLAAKGDERAIVEQERLAMVPLLQSLQVVVRTLLVSAYITFCVVAYGVVLGVLVGTLTVLLLPLAFRVKFVCSLADRLRDITLPSLEKVARSTEPALRWLRSRDAAVGDDVRLNSQTELLDLIERSPGILTNIEQQRLAANLAFDTKIVKEVMTPRPVIKAVEANEVLGPLLLDELYKTGFSRFPVYRSDIDHVVGMLYLHDLLDVKTGNKTKTAEKAMHPKAFYIHEQENLSHALHGFLKTRHHLFVVVNEYRETVGLLSLEDVIEALIGATIVDEFDAFDDLRAVAERNPNRNNQPERKKDI